MTDRLTHGGLRRTQCVNEVKEEDPALHRGQRTDAGSRRGPVAPGFGQTDQRLR